MPGLDRPGEIDLISEDTDGNALLSIVQTGPWSSKGSERAALQRKLDTYVHFALEGQMVHRYPSLKDRPVVIELAYEHKPPQSVLDYWRQAAKTAKHKGVRLGTRSLDETVWRA